MYQTEREKEQKWKCGHREVTWVVDLDATHVHLVKNEPVHPLLLPRHHFMTFTAHRTNSEPRNYMSSYNTCDPSLPSVRTLTACSQGPQSPRENTNLTTERLHHRRKKIKRCKGGGGLKWRDVNTVPRKSVRSTVHRLRGRHDYPSLLSFSFRRNILKFQQPWR